MGINKCTWKRITGKNPYIEFGTRTVSPQGLFSYNLHLFYQSKRELRSSLKQEIISINDCILLFEAASGGGFLGIGKTFCIKVAQY